MAFFASHPFKVFTGPCCMTLRSLGSLASCRSSALAGLNLKRVQITQTHKIRSVLCKNKAPLPQSEPLVLSSFAMFTSARMLECRDWVFLDSRRYIEVVEVQRDGQPRIHISKILWSRFNLRFDCHHDTSDGGCTMAIPQSM